MSQKIFGSRPRFNGYQVLLDDGTFTAPAASGITGLTATTATITAGNLTAVQATVTSANSASFTLTSASTYAAGVTLAFECSTDNTYWEPITAIRTDTGYAAPEHLLTSAGAGSAVKWDVPVVGTGWIRVRPTSAFTVDVSIRIQPSYAMMPTPLGPPRINNIFYRYGQLAGTSGNEMLLNLLRTQGTSVSGSSASSFSTSAAYRLRINAVHVGFANPTTGSSVATATFRLRYNASGAITTSSPILTEYRIQLPAVTGQWQGLTVALPDGGYEIPGDNTGCYGWTLLPSYTTNVPYWDIFVAGYEYKVTT